MEVFFYSPNATIDQPQDELLSAARHAMIHTFGWLIGPVLDAPEKRPRPRTDGIFAEIRTQGFNGYPMYDYWALTRSGDFYSLSSLLEDDGGLKSLSFNVRIARTAEALMYCERLYRNLGANGNVAVRFSLRHFGLRGRVLKASGSRVLSEKVSSEENEVTTEVEFLLEDVAKDLVDLTQKLCEPLFLVFDFTRFKRTVYEQIVTDFVNGKVS